MNSKQRDADQINCDQSEIERVESHAEYEVSMTIQQLGMCGKEAGAYDDSRLRIANPNDSRPKHVSSATCEQDD